MRYGIHKLKDGVIVHRENVTLILKIRNVGEWWHVEVIDGVGNEDYVSSVTIATFATKDDAQMFVDMLATFASKYEVLL